MLETDKIAVVGFLNGKKNPRMKILSWRKFKNKPMSWNIVLLFAIFLLHVRLSVELECHFKFFTKSFYSCRLQIGSESSLPFCLRGQILNRWWRFHSKYFIATHSFWFHWCGIHVFTMPGIGRYQNQFEINNSRWTVDVLSVIWRRSSPSPPLWRRKRIVVVNY